jgi:hypothetical protein
MSKSTDQYEIVLSNINIECHVYCIVCHQHKEAILKDVYKQFIVFSARIYNHHFITNL